MKITSIMAGLEEGETLTLTLTRNRLRVQATATKMGTTISAAGHSNSDAGDEDYTNVLASVINSLRSAGNTKTGEGK